MLTWFATRDLAANIAFVSLVEPKNNEEVSSDEYWIIAMQEELNQFVRNNVWKLVSPPTDYPIIGIKWMFRNKFDDMGNIVRNKARLVAQGYRQEKGIDYDETFALVARLKFIRMLLTFACFMNFKLFQMDVKSAFLNGFIVEEVYVKQHPCFENKLFPNHVSKLKKALYGLKQAPRAWYDRLKNFLIDISFTIGCVDSTLFLKKTNNYFLIVQIYVDDIIFGSTNEFLCKEFSKQIQNQFEMNNDGEVFFLS